MDTAPLFSLCIPAYNEAALLPRLLDSVDLARARFRGGPDAIEVVVGNNGSTDTTAEMARARGCVVVDVEKRAIAAARNGAAGAARGAILCFIDADSIVHPETFNEIDDTMRAGRCVVGATGVKMERMSLGIALTWLCMVPMTRVVGMDTGVVFCRREDFAAIGGYTEAMLVAEDVDFLWRLKKLGRKRGAKFMRTPTARAITSTRKFDKYGDWHYFRIMFGFPFKVLFAKDAARRVAMAYWYNDR
jgi:glycosyltransferase involved in cell wall biosynthesis